MRIAYVCADPGVPVFGRKGCSVHVQEMMRALRNRGAAVELFAVRRGGECPSDLRAIPLHELREFRHPAAPPFSPTCEGGGTGGRPGRDDEQWVRHCNALLQRELDQHGPFDMVYERYSLWSYAGMAAARAAKVPGVLEVNAPLIEEQTRYRQLDNRALAQRIAGRAFEAASLLCAVSSQVAKYLQSFPTARGRIHVLHNGVDPARFCSDGSAALARRADGSDGRPAEARPLSQGFTVGFVGSLKPWHGLSTLATAFAQLHKRRPDSRLLIVGDGPERENFVAQLAAENSDALAATSLTGGVPPDDIPRYLSSMDVAVAPYPALPDFYFSPLKIFEYMAAGLPVIASRVGDLKQIICDGINGILCAPGDAVALAAALDRIGADPALRCRLGVSARTTVLERHTWDAVVQRVLSWACDGDPELGARGRPSLSEPCSQSPGPSLYTSHP